MFSVTFADWGARWLVTLTVEIRVVASEGAQVVAVTAGIVEGSVDTRLR
jgi:hypothetical protein